MPRRACRELPRPLPSLRRVRPSPEMTAAAPPLLQSAIGLTSGPRVFMGSSPPLPGYHRVAPDIRTLMCPGSGGSDSTFTTTMERERGARGSSTICPAIRHPRTDRSPSTIQTTDEHRPRFPPYRPATTPIQAPIPMHRMMRRMPAAKQRRPGREQRRPGKPLGAPKRLLIAPETKRNENAWPQKRRGWLGLPRMPSAWPGKQRTGPPRLRRGRRRMRRT